MKLYDLSRLQKTFEGNEALVEKMTQNFLNKTPLMLRELNEHFVQGNLDNVAQVAHKLKSSIGLMNIKVIDDEINIIEKCHVKEISPERLSQLIAKVNYVCESVFEQLTR
ncbi:MAG: hypothetical protein HC880_02285 [Bacteroidia bacterium]|nr:hypothetical protein [Bacteroidia bacterium]